jgi:hypothetical protein
MPVVVWRDKLRTTLQAENSTRRHQLTCGDAKSPQRLIFSPVADRGNRGRYLSRIVSRKHEVRLTKIERRARARQRHYTRGRRGLGEIVSGSITDVQQIAARQRCRIK